VVDPAGDSTLGDVQAGAMGEAWSDWYAMDYLVKRKLQTDAPDKVDVVPFQYDGAGVALDRTEPMDCKVGSTSRRCPGAGTGHRGGYTYADYGHVSGTPEVHSDGEIWEQTLWDLRDRLGSDTTEALLTRAMELSPMNPSFLDERNAILVADTALFGGRHRAGIWRVFANRGMGYYAGALGADDTSPGADFHRPPADPDLTTVHGRVTDSDSGRPVAGLTVTLAFQGARGLVNPSATTGADGSYELGAVPAGTYPKVMLTGARHLPVQRPITVLPGGGTSELSVRRDWAASNGGADIARFTGPEFDAPCGPPQAIDTSTANGWGTTTGDTGKPTNTFVPKFIVVRLPRSVDVSAFGVDPSANCGDSSSSSTGRYRIETSHDRTTWTRAARGTFTSADRGRLNEVNPSAGAEAVRFVRFWILGNQTPEFATSCPEGRFTGCAFTDLTELAVFGVPSAP